MIESENGILKSSNDNKREGVGVPTACPICKAAVVADYEPFCSKRCADVDLHRWLSGSYAIPAQADESDGTGEPGDQ